MGKDNPETVIAADKTQAVQNNTDTAGGALSRLQSDAGLQDKSSGTTDTAAAGAAAAGGKDLVWQRPDAPPNCAGDIKAGLNPPTDLERMTAEKSLEDSVSKLIPIDDRDSMKAMTDAITGGEARAFGEAVKKAGGDPEKLKELVREVNKTLKEKHCTTRLDVTGDGKVLVSDTTQSTALAFDPKTGKAEAKAVQYNPDGSVLVKPGELLNVDTDKTFKNIGDRAVNGVNGKFDFASAEAPNIATHGPGGDLIIPPLNPGPGRGGSAHPLDRPPFPPRPIDLGKDQPVFPQPKAGPDLGSEKQWEQYIKEHGYKPIEM